MEALVNSAYDRISEDIILLYDAFQAYEEASPRPPLSALLEAIRQVLKEEDKGRKAWSVWSSISREDLRALGGARMGVAAGAADTADADGDGADKTDAEVLESTESGLREVVRVVLTSVLSDLAVLPFWTVKVSAVAARGRLPELWPFQGYRVAFAAIAREEGWVGLFRGAAPICAGGILRYLRRNRRLYSDYYWKTTQRLTARLVIKDRSARALDPEMAVHAYEGVLSRAVWAVALHPFDLLATRMITEAGARYATVRAALRTAAGDGHWAGLFAGVRSSIIGACLPCSSWYALGVPFLVKTRRMLHDMDTQYRSGLGGSLDLLRDIISTQGVTGLFAGLKASCWGFVPAFGALCAARLLVYMITGSSSHAAVQRRKRKALLRGLLSSVSRRAALPPPDHERGGTGSMVGGGGGGSGSGGPNGSSSGSAAGHSLLGGYPSYQQPLSKAPYTRWAPLMLGVI